MDWYPRYPALWRTKTRHLNPFQEGCYLRLVDEYMETRQPLPDNDQALARIIGISLEQWIENSAPAIRAFFKPNGGFLFHDRCDQILNEQDALSKKQSEKSKKGAQARWKKPNEINDLFATGNATGIAEALPNHATGQDRTGDIGGKPPIEKTSFEKFWQIFPKQRIGSKEKAQAAYRKALTRTTEETIYAATQRYAQSDEVRRGFAKGCAAWLNDDRWTVNYAAAPRPAANSKAAYGDSLANAARAVKAGIDSEKISSESGGG